jgi:MoaA/NifB/PqqE/SkfB family radical SAM enzyme
MNLNSRRFLPQAISLYLTYRCQSRCPHCFLVENGKLGRYELPLERCLSIIDEASERRFFLLVLSGGEPLLHPGFSRVISHARKKGLLPLLGLTGVGVGDEHIKQIADQAIPTVQLSLDGATAQSNDKIRGTGSFAEVTGTIVRFQWAGIKANLAICLHRENAYEAVHMFELARSLGVARVKLTFYESPQRGGSMIELSDESKQEVLQKASEFTLRYMSEDWIACPTHDVHTGRNIRHERRTPPLVIGADGELNAGEWGERIGSVLSGTLTDQYSEFVH